MKRFFTSIIIFLTTLPLLAQGWPANYDGVMLQGFYWDSYADTNWANLESQADELSQYFNLIWVPQSGYCNTTTMQMGYSDIWWLDHKSAFGTEEQLRSMIKTFKTKNTYIIEDVVINHKNGNTSWCDFPNESKNGYTLTWDNVNFSGICYNDECNNTANLSKWSKNNKKTTGKADTGDNFDGCRDLDHTNEQVQQNIKTYLNFLLNDLGYSGFRYDMVKGYKPMYTGIYNESVQPTFSVGEFWDESTAKVKNWIDGTKVNSVIQSAAFDFPMKFNINAAFANGNWAALNNVTLTTTSGYSRYSVTFIDNHDTDKKSSTDKDGILKNNVTAANAYIMAMPGTPCLFLKHWQSYKGTLKKLIFTRKAVGINNQSEILSKAVSNNGYILNVKGSKGKVLLLLGNATAATEGYQLAVEGNNYKYYVSSDIDLSMLNNITDIDKKTEKVEIPACCKVNDGETCAFFEAPETWTGPIYCWRWDYSYNYTSNKWPGVECKEIGYAKNGRKVWKWSWDGNKTSQKSPNSGIIFSNNSNPQTPDLVFENAGYYTEDGLVGNVLSSTGIRSITKTTEKRCQIKVYTIDGHLLRVLPAGTTTAEALNQLQHGLYLINGRKYVK